eukprot:CFRG3476T1
MSIRSTSPTVSKKEDMRRTIRAVSSTIDAISLNAQFPFQGPGRDSLKGSQRLPDDTDMQKSGGKNQCSDGQDDNSVEDQEPAKFTQNLDLPLPKWLRSGFVQNIFVGLIAFCCPGMFNALQGLGNAGGDDPVIVGAMNATLYGFFAIAGFFGGSLFNILGNKLLMALGGFTYVVYAVAVYLWGQNADFAPFGIAAAALLGVGAGCLWTAQGAMTLTYCSDKRRGQFTAIFWVLFNLGAMAGGLITMGVEWSQEEQLVQAKGSESDVVLESGSITPLSYFLFCGIMGFGVVMAMLLLVHPSKIEKDDGEKVKIAPASTFQVEIWSVITLLGNTNMQLLSLLFLQSNWYYTYSFNAFNGSLFQPASRGLNSAIFWGMQMIGATVMGVFILDPSCCTRTDVRRRAIMGILFVGFVNITQWALTAAYQFHTGYDKNNPPTHLFSVQTGGVEYWVPTLIFAYMGFVDAVIQTYAYWIIGALSSSTNVVSRYFGFYKSVQSLGACIAWSLEFGKVSYDIQMLICIALAIFCLLPTFWVAISLPDDQVGIPSSVDETTAAVDLATAIVESEERELYGTN